MCRLNVPLSRYDSLPSLFCEYCLGEGEIEREGGGGEELRVERRRRRRREGGGEVCHLKVPLSCYDSLPSLFSEYSHSQGERERGEGGGREGEGGREREMKGGGV